MPIQTRIFRASERRPSHAQDVHFHRGPQGQPVPCYERSCQMPSMASQDVREAARAAQK